MHFMIPLVVTSSKAAHNGCVSELRCRMNSALGKLAITRRTFSTTAGLMGTLTLLAAVALI